MLLTSYLVLRDADPVVLQVKGRASFDNCAAVRTFFADCRQRRQKSFVVDLKDCQGMDSTFLGILAGLANEVSALEGQLLLTRPSESLMSVIRNLGLDKLLHIAEDLDTPAGPTQTLPAETLSEIEQARMVLHAHENLVEANPATRPNFLDVIDFLKERLGNTPSS